jgi:ribonuclease PH
MLRADGRRPDQLRPVSIQRGYTAVAPGSVLISAGRTIVLCTACLEDGVPEWRAASGAGWVTGEYDMLPGSTGSRRPRNRKGADGRTREIERLIGRALRAVVDMRKMGPRTIWLDCDVLQADGGTRTASITGAYVALCDALREGERRGWWGTDVRQCAVAAVSAGIVEGQVLLDLDYREDSAAAVDCNLVLTDRGQWIEVQSTGEQAAFSDDQLQELLRLGRSGIETLFRLQQSALAPPAA